MGRAAVLAIAAAWLVCAAAACGKYGPPKRIPKTPPAESGVAPADDAAETEDTERER